jgi:hypothetical protein
MVSRRGTPERRMKVFEIMRYILTGFSHDAGFRVFTFDCVETDRVRTEFKVRVDLAISRRYGIRVQELPLLCRAILEQSQPGERQSTITYSEADMCLQAEERAARVADAQKKKMPRRPPSQNLGAAWRSSHMQLNSAADGSKV